MAWFTSRRCRGRRKIRKPSDVVSVGDIVEVVVLGVNPGEKRISLGLKQALGDPWEEAEKKYAVGSIVEGPITNMTNFGAFVDLGSGVEGMIHVGDITREKRLEHPEEVLQTGATVKAQVLEFDRVEAPHPPGDEATGADQHRPLLAEHQVGEAVTGRVVEVKGDRVKVELGDGVFGTCKLVVDGDAGDSRSRKQPPGGCLCVTAMLAAKWKGGGQGDPGSKGPEKNAIKPGQIRTFKISNLDPQQKRIQLEVA